MQKMCVVQGAFCKYDEIAPPDEMTSPYVMICDNEIKSVVLHLFLRYEWEKDGEPIDFSSRTDIVKITEGLVINVLEDNHEGVYQCFASNDYGRAVAIRTCLKKAGV